MVGEIWWVLLIVTVTSRMGTSIGPSPGFSREKRLFYGKYFPLNIRPPNRPNNNNNNNGNQPQLSIGDNQTLTTINFFRALHQVPPVTWDAQLARQALLCANTLVAQQNLQATTTDCPDPGTSRGYSRFANAVVGSRDAILQSWYDEFRYVLPQNYFSNPTPFEGAEGYLQMIWRSSTRVGCGYSSQGTDPLNPVPSDNPADPPPFYAFICIWNPPGYQPPEAFPQNIRPPVGS